ITDDGVSHHHNLNVFRQFCGDETLANVVFVTGPLNSQVVDLQPLLDQGATVGNSA
ncbi:hypothetical protein FRC11_002950, partial [Ceratobasidium sp. 423]